MKLIIVRVLVAAQEVTPSDAREKIPPAGPLKLNDGVAL